MGKELSRFELAIVKRTAQNTKALRTKRDKTVAKIATLTAELQEIEAVIEKFEAPVREITGGLSSFEVLEELKKAEETETVENEGYTVPEVDDTQATCETCECDAVEEPSNVAEDLGASASE